MSAIVLGWVLAHALWQTALLALAYAVWRAHSRRSSISRRHDLALTALALGVAAAGASLWSLSRTEPAHQRLRSGPPASAATAAHTLPAASLRAPVPATWPRAGDLSAAVSGLAALWTAGVLVLAVRMGGGLLLARRIRRRAAAVRSGPLDAAGRALALRLGIGRPVPLLESSEIEAPVTLGWLRPAVLFPVDLLRRGAPATLEALLAHELAHVRAGDYAVNLAQTGLDALFFLCPGARWLSAQVRQLREYRCDDRAVALCPGRMSYARALASLVQTRRPALAAPGAGGPRLVDRIRRLSEGDPMSRPRARWTPAAAAAMAATAWAGASLLPLSRVHAAAAVAAATTATPAAASGTAWNGPCPLALDPAFPGNEFVPQPAGRYFDCNPMRLDGRPLSWQSFSTKSRGTLTLVHGDPPSRAETPIAFTIALRREGRVLSDPTMRFVNRVLYQVELAEVLVHARPGDHLIIDPVDKNDWRAKRIVALALGC